MSTVFQTNLSSVGSSNAEHMYDEKMKLESETQSFCVLVNACLGTAFNSFLITLILTDKRAGSEGYGRMLIIISLYNIYYAFIHGIIDMGFVIDEYGFLMFSKRMANYGYWPAYIGVMVYVDAFTMSITLLAIHCLYRYVRLSGKWTYLFSDWKYLTLIGLFNFLFGLMWVAFCHYSMEPSQLRNELSRAEVMELYNFSTTNLGYIGPVYERVYPNGTTQILWKNTIGSTGCMGILFVAYSIISAGCAGLYLYIRRASVSNQAKRLHFQLLRLLLSQSIVPLIFEYIPCVTTVWGGAMGFPKFMAFYIPIFISSYSYVDAVCVIFLFTAYRRRVASLLNFACKKTSTVLQWTVDSSGPQSATIGNTFVDKLRRFGLGKKVHSTNNERNSTAHPTLTVNMP